MTLIAGQINGTQRLATNGHTVHLNFTVTQSLHLGFLAIF